MTATGRGVCLRSCERGYVRFPCLSAPSRCSSRTTTRCFLESLRALIDRQPELAVIAKAVDGLQAIELADTHEVDAAVIDLHMPLLDGVTTVARLRRDHPNLCVLVLTGDCESRDSIAPRPRRGPTRCSRSTS